MKDIKVSYLKGSKLYLLIHDSVPSKKEITIKHPRKLCLRYLRRKDVHFEYILKLPIFGMFVKQNSQKLYLK